jgi:hypothetical protein
MTTTLKIRATVVMAIIAVGTLAPGCKKTPMTPTTTTITPTSVTVTGNSTVQVGQQTQLTSRANMSDGTAVNVTASGWNSSDGSRATVNSSGLVTGVATGSTNITAAFQGLTSAVFPLQVTAAPIVIAADFTITPDPGSGVTGSQCGVSQTGASNTLKCTFDASVSSPKTGITSYSWEIPVGGATFTGNPKQDVLITCGVGSFAGASGSADKPVKLTITTTAGSATTTKTVTFVKAGAC